MNSTAVETSSPASAHIIKTTPNRRLSVTQRPYRTCINRPGENHSLPGTSPITYNVSEFYEANGLSLRLTEQYVGHSLYQIGGGRNTDQFEDSRFTLDFTSSYDFSDQWSVYFNVRNITNAPLRIYLGFPNWVIQREFYDQTFETGVRIKL